MADREGNVLLPPGGINQKAEVRGDGILYSYSHILQKGVTLAAGQGVLAGGTVLGRVTATKRYKAYSNAASDGTEKAVGILRDSVDTNSGERLANILLSAEVKTAKIVGLDSAAITDLGARSVTEFGVTIF